MNQAVISRLTSRLRNIGSQRLGRVFRLGQTGRAVPDMLAAQGGLALENGVTRATNAPLSGYEMQILMMVRNGRLERQPPATLARLQALGLIEKAGDGFVVTPAGQKRCDQAAS